MTSGLFEQNTTKLFAAYMFFNSADKVLKDIWNIPWEMANFAGYKEQKKNQIVLFLTVLDILWK